MGLPKTGVISVFPTPTCTCEKDVRLMEINSKNIENRISELCKYFIENLLSQVKLLRIIYALLINF